MRGGVFLITTLGFQGLVKPVLRQHSRKETLQRMILPYQPLMHQPGQGTDWHPSLATLLLLNLVDPPVTRVIPLVTHDSNNFIAMWIPTGLFHDCQT